MCSSIQASVRCNIGWVAPINDFFKLNVDGAVTGHGAIAAAGGVLRNFKGGFMFGFASHLGSGTTTEVELEAILIGIKLSRLHGYNKIIIESDSLVAVNLIGVGVSSQHPSFNLLHDIRGPLNLESNFSVIHTLREGNQVADCFAKFGLSLNFCSSFFRKVPGFASFSLRADMAGTMFPRGL